MLPLNPPPGEWGLPEQQDVKARALEIFRQKRANGGVSCDCRRRGIIHDSRGTAVCELDMGWHEAISQASEELFDGSIP